MYIKRVKFEVRARQTESNLSFTQICRESYARGDVIYAQKFKFYHSAARQSEAKLLRKRQRIYL
ncbi:hypothetical protein [uncultured Campylobacter sp.]|uniref:hypothetical protein n=1 Tax=uncultured Campylobacter sp. TaxID=218934 RepID=UPI00261E4E8D|nr:hypothetical protein [uncultured Campylobacter sp.]